MTSPQGEVNYTWPVALNDESGRWTIRVEELTSQIIETQLMELKP